jgi:hypothetical protein
MSISIQGRSLSQRTRSILTQAGAHISSGRSRRRRKLTSLPFGRPRESVRESLSRAQAVTQGPRRRDHYRSTRTGSGGGSSGRAVAHLKLGRCFRLRSAGLCCQLGRLHDARSEAVPAARGQRRADLQLVEFVRPSGRSGSPARGDHQPTIADAGDRPADPTCRTGHADHHQHVRRAAQGTPRLSADRRLPGAVASNCGAVGFRCNAGIASSAKR